MSDAENPYFVDYLYDPSLTNISPEGLYFVSAEDSDTGRPILVVSHELSGTITTFDITSLLEDTETPVEEPGEEVPGEETPTEVPGEGKRSTPVTPIDSEGSTDENVKVIDYIETAKSVKANSDVDVDLDAASALSETGAENTSVFGLLGLAIATLGSFLGRQFKKEN